jgi:hypothetical protein
MTRPVRSSPGWTKVFAGRTVQWNGRATDGRAAPACTSTASKARRRWERGRWYYQMIAAYYFLRRRRLAHARPRDDRIQIVTHPTTPTALTREPLTGMSAVTIQCLHHGVLDRRRAALASPRRPAGCTRTVTVVLMTRGGLRGIDGGDRAASLVANTTTSEQPSGRRTDAGQNRSCRGGSTTNRSPKPSSKINFRRHARI